jgi:hypothetical protein
MITLRELLDCAKLYLKRKDVDLDAPVEVMLFYEHDERARSIQAGNVGCDPKTNTFFVTAPGPKTPRRKRRGKK